MCDIFAAPGLDDVWAGRRLAMEARVITVLTTTQDPEHTASMVDRLLLNYDGIAPDRYATTNWSSTGCTKERNPN